MVRRVPVDLVVDDNIMLDAWRVREPGVRVRWAGTHAQCRDGERDESRREMHGGGRGRPSTDIAKRNG